MSERFGIVSPSGDAVIGGIDAGSPREAQAMAFVT